MAAVLPSKFVAYLNSPNTSFFLTVGPIEARKGELVVGTTLEWLNTTGGATTTMDSTVHRGAYSPEIAHGEVLRKNEKLTMWFEDTLLNSLFNQFRWNFEWLREDIPVDSPRLPQQTREFLGTLCTNCYFEVHVSANGPPRVVSVNESIVMET